MLARNALPATPARLRGTFNAGQRWAQFAPQLALVGSTGAGKHMQNHAPFGYMA